MVRNLSRKSSTVFQSPASTDPLPPLPAGAASLRSGFTTALNQQVDGSDSYEQLAHLLKHNMGESQMVDYERPRPSASSNDYKQTNALEHKKSQRFMREEQKRLETLLDDIKAQTASFTMASRSISRDPAAYTKPFTDFLTENPTIFHVVETVKLDLGKHGFKQISERDEWSIQPGGKYYVERNGSSIIAFSVGANYKPGNGAAIIAGHIDALTAKLKPISKVPNKAGFVQLGVAPYAGALNSTWWDRDLGIGGRVLVRQGNKIVEKLVKLDYPIARIPTLAPHFGAVASGPFNPETQMVPIIGLESSSADHTSPDETVFRANTFAATQPPRLVRAIARELGLRESDYSSIVNWELELYDHQPATVGGLDKEFIYAGRIDDKLCSWAALQALLNSVDDDADADSDSGIIKVVALFDDEEIGSLLRQGARGNFLPLTIERAVTSLTSTKSYGGGGSSSSSSPANPSDLLGRTFANSFLVSADVTHAVNPNFLNAYLENHAPGINIGVAVSADSNGHMTTDAVSTALFKETSDRVGAKLQVFQIRNDVRSGGTVGPMLSAATGIRGIDVGIVQWSMHSIRATTGSLDPGLGVRAFEGFLTHFEDVDREFR